MYLSQEILLKETSDNHILTNRKEAAQVIAKIYEAKKTNYALNNNLQENLTKGALEEIFSFNKAIEKNFEPDTFVHFHLNSLVQQKELEFLQYFLEKTKNTIHDMFLAPKGYVIRDENMKTILFSSATRIEKIFPFASFNIRNNKDLILQARGNSVTMPGLSSGLSLALGFKSLSKNLKEDEELQNFAISDGLSFSFLPPSAQQKPSIIQKSLEKSLSNWTFIPEEYKTLDTFISTLPVSNISTIPKDLENLLIEEFKSRNMCISLLEQNGELFPYAIPNHPLNKNNTVDFGIIHAAIKGRGYNILSSAKENHVLLDDYQMSLLLDTLIEKDEFKLQGTFSSNYQFEKLSALHPHLSELSKKIFLEDDTQRITMEEAMLKVSIMLKDKAMREDIVHLDNLVEKEPTFKKPSLKF